MRIVKSFLINKFIFLVLYIFSPHLCIRNKAVKYLKANNQNFNTFLFAQYKNITIFTTSNNNKLKFISYENNKRIANKKR